jgi:hypothetical protein
MFLNVYTNDLLRKTEFTKEDVEFDDLLAQMPVGITDKVPNVISIDFVDDILSFYFNGSVLTEIHNRDDVVLMSLKFHPKTSVTFYKWYVAGNPLGMQNLDNIRSTGFYSNSDDICIYQSDLPLNGLDFINGDFTSKRIGQFGKVISHSKYVHG